MPYRLEANETISSGVRRVLLERVEQIIIDLTEAPKGRDKGVHDARKNCKRIRAAYRLIRDEIGQDLYRQENIRFRDSARLLAGARDSWVMIRTLDRLIEKHQDQLPSQPFIGIREKLVEKYETTLAREQKNQTTIPTIVETMREACCQIDDLPIVNKDFSAFQPGLQRVYFRGRRGLQQAYSLPSSEGFHEWRKRVKYLWYQLEFLAALWPKVLSRLADELHTLSEYLGDDHDLAVLRATVLDLSAGFESRKELLILVRLIDQDRLILEALARPLGKRLYFDPPKTFTSRLENYWRAWETEDLKRQRELIQHIQDRSPAYIREDKDIWSTSEMAAHLEVSPERVRRLIHNQKLPAEKIGPVWIIKAESEFSLTDGNQNDDDILMSTREVADQLNITLRTIWKMIQLEELPAIKVGRYWVIRESDLL